MMMFVHIYLCFKSHILMRNDGHERPKHVAFKKGKAVLLQASTGPEGS